MTRRPAEPRRTRSTDNPAGAEPAAPAAARSPPAARRTPTPPPASAAGAGRDPRTRSPSAPPPAPTSTAGRGSAGPRRRPDLPPAGRSRQLSGQRRGSPPCPLQCLAAATAAPQDPGLPARASSAARARSRRRWSEADRQWAPNQATSGRRQRTAEIRASPGGGGAPSRAMQCNAAAVG